MFTSTSQFQKLLILLGFHIFLFEICIATSTTFQLIKERGYHAEKHTIRTGDGYALTLFRMTSNRKFAPTNHTQSKPVVLLIHGFVLTSDAWVLSDPSQNLAFLLADAGCDVWLGNQRGNSYSRQHKSLDIAKRPFWNFSWHEIGFYDLAAMFDYILAISRATGLHYIGYSQGTSVLLVLLSTRPEYSEKVNTIHFLAPVVYMQNMRQPFAKLSPWLHNLGATLAAWFGFREVLHYTKWPYYREVCEFVCDETNALSFLCSGLFELVGGTGSHYINTSLLPAICASHPAGASTKQILHFLQVYNTGKFEQYDYGAALNLQLYRQSRPPAYRIESISNCINLYYSNSDYLSAAADVEQLSKVLQCAKLKRIKFDGWNHYDFLWSYNIKEAMCDLIIEEINLFEESRSLY